MNAKRFLMVATLAAAFGARAADDERIEISQLPPAVQKTLEDFRGGAPIKKVVRRVLDGRPVYLIEIEKNNAPNPLVRITEEGAIIREPSLPYVSTSDIPVVVPEFTDAARPISPPVQLSELPAAVQQAARREARGREIADVDRETWNGKPVYEVEFKERGLNSRVYLAEDGALVRDERSRRSLKSVFMGLQLEDTPAAVQQTIHRIAGDREVVDIDRKRPAGQTDYYRIELRDAQGTHHLRLGADGEVLYDSRSPGKQSRG